MAVQPLVRSTLALSLGAVLAAFAGEAHAQRPSGENIAPAAVSSPLADTVGSSAIVGRVVDADGVPLRGAEVALLLDGRTVRTDTAGRFALTSLTAGHVGVQVRRLGYVPASFTVLLGVADRHQVQVLLQPVPVRLAQVRVVAPRAPVFGRAGAGRYAAFNERRSLGNGRFWDRSQIAKMSPQYMSDIFRRTPGVRLNRDRSGRMIVSARANGGNCPMRLFVDGQSIPLYGLSIDDFVRPGDVEAVEIYPSLGAIPAEYGGRGPSEDSRCGVVVVWTRVE